MGSTAHGRRALRASGSGCRYPGFAVGGELAAFFALLHDQPLAAPIMVFAQTKPGRGSRFVDNTEKPFRRRMGSTTV